MTREEFLNLRVGEIRYQVFLDSEDGKPWIARLRLVSLSPRGRSARWDSPDRDDGWIMKSTRYDAPYIHPREAIAGFQRRELFGSRFYPGDRKRADEGIRRIVAANGLERRWVSSLLAVAGRGGRISISVAELIYQATSPSEMEGEKAEGSSG